MSKIKTIFSAVGILAATSFSASAVHAADNPIVWRMHTPHTEGRMVYGMEKDWADMVMAGTNNRIKVQMYPGGALGFKDADILGAMKNGLVETSYVYGGYYSRDEPALGMILAQMVFNSREEFLKTMPAAFEQYGKLYADWGIQLASLWPTLTCNVATMGKEPYPSLKSLQGKKIRVWEAQQVDTLKQLGVSAVVIPQNDLYLAMKTGVVDGAVHFPEALKELSLHEDAKYFSLMQPAPVAQGIGISKKALQSLPVDLQKAVQEASAKHREKWLSKTQECQSEKEDIEWATGKGVKKIPDFSAEDRQRISDVAVKVWRARAARVGGKAVEYQQIMEKELMKVRAGS
jgi:TRAP-type C4-dicarboxylate transport system substrate-binding protein